MSRKWSVIFLIFIFGFIVFSSYNNRNSLVRQAYAGVIGGEEGPPGGNPAANASPTQNPENPPGANAQATPTQVVVPTCQPGVECPNATPTPSPTGIECDDPCNPNAGEGGGGGAYCGPNRLCVNGKCLNSNQTCRPPDGPNYDKKFPCQCKNKDCSCTGLTCQDSDPNRGRAIIVPIIEAPACWVCNKVTIDGVEADCNLLTPTPSIVYDRLVGKACKTYSVSVEGGDGVSCPCSGSICCPRCEEPKVEPGFEEGCAKCDFGTKSGDTEVSCPCVGKKTTFSIGTRGCVDFGDGTRKCGTYEAPPEHEYGGAGFYPITLSCEVGGQTYTCKKTVVVACSCDADKQEEPTPDPSILLTPAWYKLRDDQFHKQDAIENPIPSVISAYDGDDTARPTPACDADNPTNIRCFDLNQAGAVAAVSTINLGDATVSARMWKHENYPLNTVNRFTPAVYLRYVKSRKQVKTITDFADLTKNKINIYNGNLTINDIDRAGNGEKIIDILQNENLNPYVLIINGDLIIETEFNQSEALESPNSLAIVVTGTIYIHYSTVEIGGIFITQALDFSYGGVRPSDYRLKIKGNIISFTPADPGDRRRSDDPTKPSIFVVRDVGLDLDVAPFFSQPVYEWEQQAS